jgi:hypothetical protein
MRQLQQLKQEGKCLLFRSRAVLREVERTKDENIRQQLKGDHDQMDNITNDEKLLGINHYGDRFGTWINTPMIADVQDDKICERIHQELNAGHHVLAISKPEWMRNI